MFDWSRVNDHTAIHCKTEQEADQFLSECGKHEIKWCTGDSAEQKREYDFSDYGTNTAFFLDNKTICFGDVVDDVDDYEVIEFSDLYKPDLPRICYILGGEDNPLKVGENFKVIHDPCTYFANQYGVYTTGGTPMSSQTLLDVINHPEKIIRYPQFSDDEKALMRLCGDNGYWQWYRDVDGQLHAKEYDEMYGPEINCVSMKGVTGDHTHNHPFDAAAYLESEARK